MEAKDHLGNKYTSQKALCEAYNISLDLFRDRLNSGMSLAEALTTPKKHGRRCTECIDHLGNKYSSISKMAKAWGLSGSTYTHRVDKQGWSVEEALTTPSIKSRDRYVDHLGNKFNSRAEMCEFHHVNLSTFDSRRARGWSIERALLPENQGEGQPVCQDHLGNTFSSQNELCRHYNIKVNAFKRRITQGWSLEDALTKPVVSTTQKVVDPLGREFRNKSEMCKAWGVRRETLNYNLRRGMTLEEALKIPKEDTSCTDHLGNTFSSMSKMCEYWNINHVTVLSRMKTGMSLEEALTTRVDLTTLKRAISNGWKVVSLVYEADGLCYYYCTKGKQEEVLTEGEIRGET